MMQQLGDEELLNHYFDCNSMACAYSQAVDIESARKAKAAILAKMRPDWRDAVGDFLSYGHPREGSNDYHRAWETLNNLFKSLPPAPTTREG